MVIFTIFFVFLIYPQQVDTIIHNFTIDILYRMRYNMCNKSNEK
jgi:hypothetical protein